MKKYIHYIFCILGVGFFTGCMLEEEVVENMDDNLVHMIFAAMVEEGDAVTKTLLDENEVAGVRSVLWSPGDEIGVATYGGTYYQFKNTLEEPAANGVFEGSVSQDNKYYSIYPYKKDQKMSTSVSVTIPTQQTYKPNSFDGSAAPMVGKGNHAEPLHFMNLCGALAVQLTGNEKVRSIIFQATSGEKVSGEGTVDPDYGDYPVLQMGDVADNFIILDCGEGVQLSGTPTTFHFVLPPGTYNGFKLIIATADGQFMEKSTDKQLTIKRSIVTKAASLAFENTATNFTDLSERGTANSYIVTQADYYSFDATVIGNGEFGFPANNNFHTNSPEISPVSAELLWADNHALIKGCGYDASTGMVKFLASGEEGNGVIAAKDSEGNILWSWHIWMTDQPEEQVYDKNAGTMMDRNLGATSATPGDVGALGLLYQWGRKDPFLGSASISGCVERVSTITWPSPVASDDSSGTIEYSVMNPTTFIKTNADWYYTGSSLTDNTRWQSEKTIYDPCPPGWRVPDAGDEGVWATVIGKSSTVSGYAYDNTNEGLNFAQNFGNASTIWYPASGGLASNSGNIVNVGYKGDYWSCTPCQNSNEARKFSFSDGGSVYPSTTSTRASGCVVRCFKQGTGSEVNYDNDFSISGAESLSDSGTANSYIVSSSGTYSIPTVKGNSSESVGDVEFTEVLWESFGTDLRPLRGDLVKGTRYENGIIYFKTNDEYKEGNAVVVAKDASGTILWSWHIWFTDQPQEQVYFNNAGTMMDRNLGAISATPGDVGALGLLYQWGRKDPFLGSMSISSSAEPKSTITWPSYVLSNSTNGTIEYTISNPTTFIKYNSSNVDWYYTGSNSTDNTRWQSEKTIYDPCPAGWRVPDGGDNGVWSTALGSSSNYTDTFDTSSKGIDFSGKLGSDETIWYPASGYRHRDGSGLGNVGSYGYCWAVTPYSSNSVYELEFNKNGSVQPSNGSGRAFAGGVRCFKVTD